METFVRLFVLFLCTGKSIQKLDPGIPPGWSVYFHEGRPYYYNEATKVTQWDYPTEMNFEQTHHPYKESQFYYNEKNQVTEWGLENLDATTIQHTETDGDYISLEQAEELEDDNRQDADAANADFLTDPLSVLENLIFPVKNDIDDHSSECFQEVEYDEETNTTSFEKESKKLELFVKNIINQCDEDNNSNLNINQQFSPDYEPSVKSENHPESSEVESQPLKETEHEPVHTFQSDLQKNGACGQFENYDSSKAAVILMNKEEEQSFEFNGPSQQAYIQKIQLKLFHQETESPHDSLGQLTYSQDHSVGIGQGSLYQPMSMSSVVVSQESIVTNIELPMSLESSSNVFVPQQEVAHYGGTFEPIKQNLSAVGSHNFSKPSVINTLQSQKFHKFPTSPQQQSQNFDIPHQQHASKIFQPDQNQNYWADTQLEQQNWMHSAQQLASDGERITHNQFQNGNLQEETFTKKQNINYQDKKLEAQNFQINAQQKPHHTDMNAQTVDSRNNQFQHYQTSYTNAQHQTQHFDRNGHPAQSFGSPPSQEYHNTLGSGQLKAREMSLHSQSPFHPSMQLHHQQQFGVDSHHRPGYTDRNSQHLASQHYTSSPENWSQTQGHFFNKHEPRSAPKRTEANNEREMVIQARAAKMWEVPAGHHAAALIDRLDQEEEIESQRKLSREDFFPTEHLEGQSLPTKIPSWSDVSSGVHTPPYQYQAQNTQLSAKQECYSSPYSRGYPQPNTYQSPSQAYNQQQQNQYKKMPPHNSWSQSQSETRSPSPSMLQGAWQAVLGKTAKGKERVVQASSGLATLTLTAGSKIKRLASSATEKFASILDEDERTPTKNAPTKPFYGSGQYIQPETPYPGHHAFPSENSRMYREADYSSQHFSHPPPATTPYEQHQNRYTSPQENYQNRYFPQQPQKQFSHQSRISPQQNGSPGDHFDKFHQP